MEFTYFDMILVLVWTAVLSMPLAWITVKTCEFIDAMYRKYNDRRIVKEIEVDKSGKIITK